MPPNAFTTTAVITQVMLAHHRGLREQINELQQQCEPSRRLLLQLAEMGADVESGPLVLRVDVHQKRPLTEANLVPIIGQAHYEHLKSLVVPTVTRQVRVVET